MKSILFSLVAGAMLVGTVGCAGNLCNHRWFWEKGGCNGGGCQSCGGGGCTGGKCDCGGDHGFECPRCGCHQGDASGHCKACGALGGGHVMGGCPQCGSGDCDGTGHCGHCHGNPADSVTSPGPGGDGGGAIGYPYYTNRGPRDFFAKNPPSIGP